MQKGLAILRGKGYYIDNFHSRGFAPRENLKFKRVEIMNKSKFLKKSLAMLLALMLVLAMIPLSASAAEGPAVTEVTVNGVTATGSDTSLTAAITEPTGDVNVTVEIENDAADVGYYGDATLKDTNEAKKVGEVWQFPLSDGDKEAKAFTFYVLDKESKQPVETYTVTFTTVAADDDATVKSVYLDNQYDCWNNIDTNKEIHYTVVAPYDLDLSTGKSYVEVTPNSATAKVYVGTSNTVADMDGDAYKVPVTAYDSRVEFTVKAENGNTMNYTVTVVRPIPFASFSIADERHESQISRVTEDPKFQVSGVNTDATVEVYLPYGAKVENDKYNFTPTFETNYDVKVYLTNQKSEQVELISGQTYNLVDFANLTSNIPDTKLAMTVKYSDGKTETWNLAFDERTDNSKVEKDTIPAIKGLTVNNYVAEIEGTTITLTLPESVRKTATDLKVDISNGTQVDVVDTNTTYTIKSNKDGFSAVQRIPAGFFNAKDRYTLRVTAAIEEFDENAPAVQDYTLNIVTAQVEKPKLNRLTLKSETTGETLEGRIDGAYVYFDGDNAIPYRYKRLDDMVADDWQLFWHASDGTTVTYNTTAAAGSNIVAISGSEIVSTWPYLPASNYRFDKTEARQYIVVANDTSSQAYKVVFTSAPASRNSQLGDVELAWNEVDNYDELNTQNKTKAVVNGDGSITAEIYYNEWDKYNDASASGNGDKGAALVTTLPAGADIYFVSKYDDTLRNVSTLNETEDTVTAWLPGVETDSGKKYNYGTTWDTTNKKHDPADGTLTLVVVSEAMAEKVTAGTTKLADITSNNNYDSLYTEYNLTLTQKAPRTGNRLETLSVYDNYTGTKITATPVGNTFTLTLPAYFVDENRKSVNSLYLDFTPEQGGQEVTAYYSTNGELTLNPLAYELDGSLDTDASIQVKQYNTASLKGWFVTANGSTVYDLSTLTVKAEDPDAKTNEYKVVIKIADAKEEAVLNSVSYGNSTATPNSDNEVTLNVPFSTEVTSMALDFNVSENAYVIEGDASGIGNLDKIVDEGETFNFLTTRTFTVVSESGTARETYTITVVPSETFPDVTTDDWFYDEVMTAANKGWITGDNGYFKPDDTMKRGDFALIIARIMNYDPENYTKSAFPDVDSDLYYSAAIAFCKEQNIIDGDNNGNFNAEDPITREEMAKILCQAKQLKVTIPEKTYADDAEIAEWAKGYVYACQEAGIMEGSGDNFNPRDNATRAEGAAVLVRAFA